MMINFGEVTPVRLILRGLEQWYLLKQITVHKSTKKDFFKVDKW